MWWWGRGAGVCTVGRGSHSVLLRGVSIRVGWSLTHSIVHRSGRVRLWLRRKRTLNCVVVGDHCLDIGYRSTPGGASPRCTPFAFLQYENHKEGSYYPDDRQYPNHDPCYSAAAYVRGIAIVVSITVVPPIVSSVVARPGRFPRT